MCRHTNFMRVLSEGDLVIGKTSTYFFTMELMDQKTQPTLRQFIAHPERYGVNLAGPAGEKIILDLSRQLAGAAMHYSGLGIVNRDLKPSNMFVSIESTTGGARVYRLIISDFGIAKDYEADKSTAPATEPGRNPGTPQYLPPYFLDFRILVAAGGQDDRSKKIWNDRAERYAVGVNMYQMFNGLDHPFKDHLAKSEVEFNQAAKRGEVTLNVDRIPPYLQPIVRKLLGFAPEKTYQDWGKLVADLQTADIPRPSDEEEGPTRAAPAPTAASVLLGQIERGDEARFGDALNTIFSSGIEADPLQVIMQIAARGRAFPAQAALVKDVIDLLNRQQ
jgi:serine/threonine protein kinase